VSAALADVRKVDEYGDGGPCSVELSGRLRRARLRIGTRALISTLPSGVSISSGDIDTSAHHAHPR